MGKIIHLTRKSNVILCAVNCTMISFKHWLQRDSRICARRKKTSAVKAFISSTSCRKGDDDDASNSIGNQPLLNYFTTEEFAECSSQCRTYGNAPLLVEGHKWISWTAWEENRRQWPKLKHLLRTMRSLKNFPWLLYISLWLHSGEKLMNFKEQPVKCWITLASRCSLSKYQCPLGGEPSVS